MAIPTPTRLVDGDATNFLSVVNFWNTYGDWLNDIPLGDVAADTISREHIVRPRINAREFIGERQIVQSIDFGLDSGSALRPEAWAGRPRLTIPPNALPRTGGASAKARWVTPIGFRTHFPESADVKVKMTWEWHVRTTAAAGCPLYPFASQVTVDGLVLAGTPVTGNDVMGFFSLVRKRQFDEAGQRLGGAWSGEGETRNWVYPLLGEDELGPTGPGATEYGFYDRGSLLWAGTCDAGTWDFALAFTGPSDYIDGFVQLDVSTVSGTLEAFM